MPTAWTNGKAVTLRDGSSVTVREMTWTGALDFLGRLATHADGILKPVILATPAPIPGQPPGPTSAVYESVLRSLVEDLPARVSQVRELGDFLLQHAVEWPAGKGPGDYGVADTLRVLGAAMEMNLSPDVQEAARALGERMAAALVKPQTPRQPA